MALKDLTLDRLLLWTGCAIIIIFFLPVVLVMLWRIPNEREAALAEKARFAAQGLADATLDPLLTEDLFTVESRMRDLVGSRRTVRYAILLDDNGRIAAHTFEDGVPQELYDLILAGPGQSVAFRSSDGPLLDVASPVLEGALGSMHVGVARDEVVQSQRQVVWAAMAILAAALAVLLFGVRRVTLLVSRPLSELDRSTRGYLPSPGDEDSSFGGSGTVEVRAIASRFVALLQQVASLEKALPPSYRAVLRLERGRPAAASVAAGAPGAAREEADGIWSQAYLEHRYDWLVFHRWVAICGIILAWLVYLVLWERRAPALPVLACIAVMAIWNGFLQTRPRWPRVLQRLPIRFWLVAQIVSDLIALTLLLHLFGGMENPFKLFFVFLMVIAALTFPLHISGLLALLGSALYGGMVIAETASFLPHHTLFLHQAPESAAVWRVPEMVLGEVVGMMLVQLGVVVFVHTVSMRRQKAEAARNTAEAIALSRERMAILGELAAGVAHEIRNPIHGLLNCCSILKEKRRPDEERKELVALLEEGLQRISTISDRLLRLSHAGELRKDRIDLGGVVHGTVRLLREAARKRGVSIEIEQENDVPLLTGDPDRLSEALLNLLNNSLDATAPGGRIVIQLETDGQAGRVVRLVVRDTGAGIPPEVMPRIFDPFFTTKGAGQGSGLGLSLVQETVQTHGGTVQVSSSVGEGTIVTVVLPIAEGSDSRKD